MQPRSQSYDVIVVGAGNAALCAALSAHERGARVLVLERAPASERGGNSVYTDGKMRVVYDGVDDYPKASARAGLAPMQRHIPWSIATARFRLARAIARRLPQCPWCGKSYVRDAKH